MVKIMTETTDTRLHRLEEALAHSEMTLSALNDELTKQWQIIDRQTRRIAELEEKIGGLEAGFPDVPPAHQPPPHY